MGEALIELAERVEASEGADNELDVLIEIALFESDLSAGSVRANTAGTKVIYTDLLGDETTYRARDWTMDRPLAAKRLRARAALNNAGMEGL